MFIKVLLLLFAVTCNINKTTAYGEVDIECVNETCTKCYKTLATELLKNADNYMALQNTFFPPDDSGPDFVIVTYIYDVNSTVAQSNPLNNHIWFWSSSPYFFYHPLRVFQFTSLGFSDPSLRQRNISLHLPETCYDSEENIPYSRKLVLLTQRLKLFAMHQKITGQVDSTYTAQSHSLITLRDWHNQHSHVSKLVLSSQVIFPVFAIIFLILYFVYLIECEPNNLGKKLNNQTNTDSPLEISAAARSKVWIIMTINILFTIGSIIADSVALAEYKRLPKEIERYINDESKAFIYLSAVPTTMVVFDVLSFVLFILVPSIVACCKRYKNCECCYSSCCTSEFKQKWCNFKFSDLLYTLLSPLLCIATHSYHIIFAFINNPYHATSVLLLYIMTLFVLIVVFQKIYYFVFNNCCKSLLTSNHSKKNCCVSVSVTILYIIAGLAMAVPIGLTVAVLIVLPLNNAIDQASNQIYAIYQATVTVFAALVTFQVFFRETNSTTTVFIKAADKFGSTDPPQKNWGDMSEKEKEIYLGEKLLSHIGFELPRPPLTLSEDNSFFCHCPCCCDVFEQPSPDQPRHCHPSCCSFPTRSNQYVRLATEEPVEEPPNPIN